MKNKTILISVTNKDGIEKFAELVELGWKIISTGNTGKRLGELGIPFTPIEEVTGFPEMLDGRLKSLHPNIFGGILADHHNEQQMQAIARKNIEVIDLIVVNFYDFKGRPNIETIDVGGPALLRAAAKNYLNVTPVIDPEDYETVINQIKRSGDLYANTKRELAVKVFEHTAAHDKAIFDWMYHKMLKHEDFHS